MRTISKQLETENQNKLERDAFIGWQMNINQPRSQKDPKPPSFPEYLRNIGLKELAEKKYPRLTKQQVRLVKNKAENNANKVINLMKRRQG